MNYNSYPSSYENGNDDQPNDSYTEWQEVLRDVERDIVDESSLEEGRSRRDIGEAIRILRDQKVERTGETAVCPRTEIVCDRDHIEGQRINVYDKRDRGKIEFIFKLRAPTEAMTILMAKSEGEGEDGQTEITTPSGATARRGQIKYEWTSSEAPPDVLCDATIFEKDGAKVFIADPSSKTGWYITQAFNGGGLVRSAINLVKIEVPFDMDPKATELILGEILEKDLGIPDALGEVPEEAEKEYKFARYKWQHVITGDLTPEQSEQAERLKSEEVFPGYTTFVEEGRHKEYLEKYGKDVRAFHRLSDHSPEMIFEVLTKGLMCTTERFSRGIHDTGLSSHEDLDTGGADNVFTRIATTIQREWRFNYSMDTVSVVFKPEVFDRTDWFSYLSDTFGSTAPNSFAKRLSPDDIFDAIDTPLSQYPSANEQMFRTGIGAKFIEAIEVAPALRDEIIAELRTMGLEEINSKPIEEIIIIRDAARKQARMQALINGEEPYTSIEEIIYLAHMGENFDDSFTLMIEPTIAQGEKERLADDMSEYLKHNMYLWQLEVLASGEIPEDSSTYEEKLFLFLRQNTLGIDYNALYEEASRERRY